MCSDANVANLGEGRRLSSPVQYIRECFALLWMTYGNVSALTLSGRELE